MTKKIVYLGPDATDAAVKRRLKGLMAHGFSVEAFCFDRKEGLPDGFISLGPAANRAIRQRFISIVRAVKILAKHRNILRGANLLYARNLDLLCVALFVRWFFVTGTERPKVVYEVLDIHPMMTRADFIGHAARTLERWLMGAISGLVTSSPGFISEYFSPVQKYEGPTFLMENKVDTQVFNPSPAPWPSSNAGLPIIITYIGKLRCIRSILLLEEIAKAEPTRLKLRLAGVVNPVIKEPFERLITLKNVDYQGKYIYPDHLYHLYSGAHLNWALDFQRDPNSRMLVPNRIYEGGAFGVVPLTLSGTEADKHARLLGATISISEPFSTALLRLFDEDFSDIYNKSIEHIMAAPRENFFVLNDYAKLGDFLSDATTENNE